MTSVELTPWEKFKVVVALGGIIGAGLFLVFLRLFAASGGGCA